MVAEEEVGEAEVGVEVEVDDELMAEAPTRGCPGSLASMVGASFGRQTLPEAAASMASWVGLVETGPAACQVVVQAMVGVVWEGMLEECLALVPDGPFSFVFHPLFSLPHQGI